MQALRLATEILDKSVESYASRNARTRSSEGCIRLFNTMLAPGLSVTRMMSRSMYLYVVRLRNLKFLCYPITPWDIPRLVQNPQLCTRYHAVSTSCFLGSPMFFS